MGFLRRLLGGSDGDGDGSPAAPPPTQDELDADERAHELDLARFEQDRTTELVRRQQRYSTQSWTPPAQGGSARSDETDEARSSEDAGPGDA